VDAKALATAWNRLDTNAQLAALPSVLSRVVFQMGSNGITLDLAEGAAEWIGDATEAERE